MKSVMSELMEKINSLEDELEKELESRRKQFDYIREGGRVRFEGLLREQHLALKKGLFRFLWDSNLGTYLTSPVIYALIVPFALLDLALTVYQGICFPAYGIPRVRRSDYIVLDRHHLAYLNLIEKLNCVYCGYANGLIAYVQEIVSRTEQYWCPIKHARKMVAAHKRYVHFLEFGDAEGYRERLEEIRAAVRRPEHQHP